MKKKFYREENTRIKEKNYAYYGLIGIIWSVNLILMSTRYVTIWPHIGELHVYSFFQIWAALQLLSRLSDHLFYITELGKKSSRLKKYECTPLSKRQCYTAYALIMAKYLTVLSAGSLFIFFTMVWLTHRMDQISKTGWGLLTFLLTNVAVYLWLLVRNIVKESRYDD